MTIFWLTIAIALSPLLLVLHSAAHPRVFPTQCQIMRFDCGNSSRARSNSRHKEYRRLLSDKSEDIRSLK